MLSDTGEEIMPCKFCIHVYSEKPCLTHLNYKKEPDKFSEFSEYWIIYYERIRNKCPCIDCLVKIVCLEGRHNCSIYQKFLKKSGIHYFREAHDLQKYIEEV